MYTLTLTLGERQAIDWIGYRYSHGDQLRRLLLMCDWEPDSVEWDQDVSIIFRIPEHIAWNMWGAIEEDNLACYCDELKAKLYRFTYTSYDGRISMKYLVIENNGETDAGAFTMLGVSSARGDKTKIGQFGSGAKHAILIALRAELDITITSGQTVIRPFVKTR